MRRPRVRLLNRIVDGRFVIDKEQVVAGANNDSGAAIFEIVEGKIVRVWFTPAVLRLRAKRGRRHLGVIARVTVIGHLPRAGRYVITRSWALN